MFQQTTDLKALSSVAIFKKIEDHFEQNQPNRLRENNLFLIVKSLAKSILIPTKILINITYPIYYFTLKAGYSRFCASVLLITNVDHTVQIWHF